MTKEYVRISTQAAGQIIEDQYEKILILKAELDEIEEEANNPKPKGLEISR